MKKPTPREFQYEKPVCLIMKEDCVDWFEPIDEGYRGCGKCSICKIAFEEKNK